MNGKQQALAKSKAEVINPPRSFYLRTVVPCYHFVGDFLDDLTAVIPSTLVAGLDKATNV
jgi:hypothetical protein